MGVLKRMRRSTLGIDANRMHVKTRQAAMYNPMIYAETCFSGRSQLTMKQLQEMSISRQSQKEL